MALKNMDLHRLVADNSEAQGHRDAEKIENRLSKQIQGAAIEVHQTLGGPGLLESLYEQALYHELLLRGLSTQRQVTIPVEYKGHRLRGCLRPDLIVEGAVIIEVKATPEDHEVYRAQVLTYLRITGLKLGLVINFGRGLLKDGYSRVANGL